MDQAGGKEGAGLGLIEFLGSRDLLVLEEKDDQAMEGAREEDYLLCKFLFSPPLPSSSSASCASSATKKMLSFGGGGKEEEEEDVELVMNGVSGKSSDSSLSTISSSPTSISTISSGFKASKDAGHVTVKKVEIGGARGTTSPRTSKKTKSEASAVRQGTNKVRKEKLGDRISALQQLVSPFGKTDTASVLHEALGYIRFLHDQVQVLSFPYLQRLPSPAHLHGPRWNDLRSRGLCLIPVSCTEHMANSSINGADLWAPMGSSKSHH